MRIARFLWLCFLGYRAASRGEVFYGGVERHGVPRLTILIAGDREAWLLSDVAACYFADRGRGVKRE